MVLAKMSRTLSRCMLACGLAVALLVACSWFGLARAAQEDSDAVHNDPQFYFRLRPRLGHFATIEGYIDMYEEYFDSVVKLEDISLSKLDINDWRRGRPTGKQCAVFLQDFQVRNYKLSKPFDIIILDACLDWLFADPNEEDSEKQVDWDRMEKDVRDNCEEMVKDQKLSAIFKSTNFKEENYSEELTNKIHSYFSRILKVNADYPKNWCHGLWMEAYNDFIEELYLGGCADERKCNFYGLEDSEKDSYLRLIAESTKQNTKVCYNVIQKQMVQLMQKDYQVKSGLNLFVSSKTAKQAKAMKWGQEMMKILQLASSAEPNQMVDLARVVKNLNRIKHEDEDVVERFTEALGEFALKNTDLKATSGDEKGLERYRMAMTKLCYPYINPKEFLKNSKNPLPWHDPASMRKPFEFYNLIYNLIRMTNHVPLYGITKQKFEKDMIQKRWVPLYLATFACQIISTTWGTIDYTTNQAAFKVALRPNAQILIEDWPIDELMTELGSEENDEEEESGDEEGDEEHQMRSLARRPKAKLVVKGHQQAEESRTSGSFGFGMNFRKNNRRQPQQQPRQVESPVQPAVPPAAHVDYAPQQPMLVYHEPPAQQQQQNYYKQPQYHQQPIRQQYVPTNQYPIVQESGPVPAQPPSYSSGSPKSKGVKRWLPKISLSSGSSKQPAAAQPQLQPQPQPQLPQKSPVMSYETIMMYKDLHGRFPSELPANIHEIYPQLPKNLDGVYPKKNEEAEEMRVEERRPSKIQPREGRGERDQRRGRDRDIGGRAQKSKYSRQQLMF